MNNFDNSLKNMVEDYVDRLRTETRTYVLAALAFVSALAWNEAFKRLFAGTKEAYGPWIYAVVITAVAVAVGMVLR